MGTFFQIVGVLAILSALLLILLLQGYLTVVFQFAADNTSGSTKRLFLMLAAKSAPFVKAKQGNVTQESKTETPIQPSIPLTMAERLNQLKPGQVIKLFTPDGEPIETTINGVSTYSEQLEGSDGEWDLTGFKYYLAHLGNGRMLFVYGDDHPILVLLSGSYGVDDEMRAGFKAVAKRYGEYQSRIEAGEPLTIKDEYKLTFTLPGDVELEVKDIGMGKVAVQGKCLTSRGDTRFVRSEATDGSEMTAMFLEHRTDRDYLFTGRRLQTSDITEISG